MVDALNGDHTSDRSALLVHAYLELAADFLSKHQPPTQARAPPPAPTCINALSFTSVSEFLAANLDASKLKSALQSAADLFGRLMRVDWSVSTESSPACDVGQPRATCGDLLTQEACYQASTRYLEDGTTPVYCNWDSDMDPNGNYQMDDDGNLIGACRTDTYHYDQQWDDSDMLIMCQDSCDSMYPNYSPVPRELQPPPPPPPICPCWWSRVTEGSCRHSHYLNLPLASRWDVGNPPPYGVEECKEAALSNPACNSYSEIRWAEQDFDARYFEDYRCGCLTFSCEYYERYERGAEAYRLDSNSSSASGPTSAPTVEPACADDPSWRGWADDTWTCATYAPEGPNAGYCEVDVNGAGVLAAEACQSSCSTCATPLDNSTVAPDCFCPPSNSDGTPCSGAYPCLQSDGSCSGTGNVPFPDQDFCLRYGMAYCDENGLRVSPSTGQYGDGCHPDSLPPPPPPPPPLPPPPAAGAPPPPGTRMPTFRECLAECDISSSLSWCAAFIPTHEQVIDRDMSDAFNHEFVSGLRDSLNQVARALPDSAPTPVRTSPVVHLCAGCVRIACSRACCYAHNIDSHHRCDHALQAGHAT